MDLSFESVFVEGENGSNKDGSILCTLNPVVGCLEVSTTKYPVGIFFDPSREKLFVVGQPSQDQISEYESPSVSVTSNGTTINGTGNVYSSGNTTVTIGRNCVGGSITINGVTIRGNGGIISIGGPGGTSIRGSRNHSHGLKYSRTPPPGELVRTILPEEEKGSCLFRNNKEVTFVEVNSGNLLFFDEYTSPTRLEVKSQNNARVSVKTPVEMELYRQSMNLKSDSFSEIKIKKTKAESWCISSQSHSNVILKEVQARQEMYISAKSHSSVSASLNDSVLLVNGSIEEHSKGEITCQNVDKMDMLVSHHSKTHLRVKNLDTLDLKAGSHSKTHFECDHVVSATCNFNDFSKGTVRVLSREPFEPELPMCFSGNVQRHSTLDWNIADDFGPPPEMDVVYSDFSKGDLLDGTFSSLRLKCSGHSFVSGGRAIDSLDVTVKDFSSVKNLTRSPSCDYRHKEEKFCKLKCTVSSD